jgi:site-specific recombinase XerD
MSVAYKKFKADAPRDRGALAAELDARVAETARELAGSYLALKRTDNTRAGYLRDLRRFFTWCATNGLTDPLEATEDDIVDYLNSLRGRGGEHASPATRARHLATLRGYYSHCRRRRAIHNAPTDDLSERVPEQSHTEGLDAQEAQALLREAKDAGPYEYALVNILLFMGLRVSEACTAELTDMRFHDDSAAVRVKRKGGKLVDVPMPKVVEDAVRQATKGRESGSLLLADGEPLDRFTAWEWVSTLAKAVGITKTISPHSLRHTFATTALSGDDPSPLHFVQQSMGHASPRTTLRYDRAAGARERFVGESVAQKILKPGS